MLVPYNEPRLLGGSGAGMPLFPLLCVFKLIINEAASPFVIALDHAGIKGLNRTSTQHSADKHSNISTVDFVNATICVSVLSIGLSSVYAGSRTLTALAETGYAPRIFSYGTLIDVNVFVS